MPPMFNVRYGAYNTIKTKGGMPTYIELLKEQDLFGFSDTKKKK